ncbi:MAG: hypothetical protein ACOX2Q_06625 [Dehalobacterium sp.]
MIKRIPNLIILGIAMIYLLKSLIAVELLETLLTVTVAGGLVLCLIFARGINGIVSYVLFFMSLVLLITFHAPWEVWMIALKKNVSLIVLYVLVPFLSFPLYYGEYIPAFNQLFTKYIYNKNRLYIVTSLLTSILAIVASIGAQHIVYTLVTPMKRHTQGYRHWNDQRLYLCHVLGSKHDSYDRGDELYRSVLEKSISRRFFHCRLSMVIRIYAWN